MKLLKTIKKIIQEAEEEYNKLKDSLETNKDMDDTDKQEIIYKIKPVKNKAVIFDSNIYHAGNVSNTERRIVLSIHFLPK